MTKPKWIKHTPPRMPELFPSTMVVAQMKEDKHILCPLEVQDIDWNCPGDEVLRYYIVERENGV